MPFSIGPRFAFSILGAEVLAVDLGGNSEPALSVDDVHEAVSNAIVSMFADDGEDESGDSSSDIVHNTSTQTALAEDDEEPLEALDRGGEIFRFGFR